MYWATLENAVAVETVRSRYMLTHSVDLADVYLADALAKPMDDLPRFGHRSINLPSMSEVET